MTWRAARRAGLACAVLAVQAGIAAGFAAVQLFSLRSLRDLLLYDPLLDPWTLLGSGTLPPIALGVWLTAGLWHLNRGAVWGLWTAAMALLVTLRAVFDWWEVGWILIFLAGQMVIAVAGIPVGRALVAGYAGARRRRWSQRRRNRRARSAAL